MDLLIVGCFEKLLAWLDRKSGCFKLPGPVVVQHGSVWLRIAPDEPPRWFLSQTLAMEYRGG